MKKYVDIIKRSKLFLGLSQQQLDAVLPCLGARVKSFSAHERIFCEGSKPQAVGVILSGEVQLLKSDYLGNTNMVSRLFSGDVIALSVCYAADKRLPFDVVSACQSDVLMLDATHLVHPCQKACAFHAQLVQNTLGILADRNLRLADKIDILTKRTLREKILAYLYTQSHRTATRSFSIPLSRNQMAEYLSVNRSALSRELAALKSDGILDFSANHFTLK